MQGHRCRRWTQKVPVWMEQGAPVSMAAQQGATPWMEPKAELALRWAPQGQVMAMWLAVRLLP